MNDRHTGIFSIPRRVTDKIVNISPCLYHVWSIPTNVRNSFLMYSILKISRTLYRSDTTINSLFHFSYLSSYVNTTINLLRNIFIKSTNCITVKISSQHRFLLDYLFSFRSHEGKFLEPIYFFCTHHLILDTGTLLRTKLRLRLLDPLPVSLVKISIPS